MIPIKCDLREPESVQEPAAKICSEFGNIDVIFNNAGGVHRGETTTLKDIADAWNEDFTSNVITAVLLTEALLGSLRKPGGRVINMSSIAALRGGGGSYSAAKAAIIGWTFDLARKLGPAGITANVIAPGYVSGTEFFGNTMTDERHRRLVSETLIGRPGVPNDIASMVVFLASEEASYITGQLIQVNGGAMLGR